MCTSSKSGAHAPRTLRFQQERGVARLCGLHTAYSASVARAQKAQDGAARYASASGTEMEAAFLSLHDLGQVLEGAVPDPALYRTRYLPASGTDAEEFAGSSRPISASTRPSRTWIRQSCANGPTASPPCATRCSEIRSRCSSGARARERGRRTTSRPCSSRCSEHAPDRRAFTGRFLDSPAILEAGVDRSPTSCVPAARASADVGIENTDPDVLVHGLQTCFPRSTGGSSANANATGAARRASSEDDRSARRPCLTRTLPASRRHCWMFAPGAPGAGRPLREPLPGEPIKFAPREAPRAVRREGPFQQGPDLQEPARRSPPQPGDRSR